MTGVAYTGAEIFDGETAGPGDDALLSDDGMCRGIVSVDAIPGGFV